MGAGNKHMRWCTFRCENGTRFTQNDDPRALHIQLHMQTPASMARYLTRHPDTDTAALAGLSFTVTDRWAPVIYFNAANWAHVPHFANNMAGYHAYIVMHEFYHAIGFREHITCESVSTHSQNSPLPILCQQTRSCFYGKGQFVNGLNVNAQ